MLRKRRAKPEGDVLIPASEGRPQPPVNVVVVVESGRKRRPRGAGQEDEGHPLLKTVLGLAVARRLARPRKRPLSKRVKKAVRKGRRKVRKTTRKVRRALR